MTTTPYLVPVAGGTIPDPSSATASERLIDYANWPQAYPTGYIWLHNTAELASGEFVGLTPLDTAPGVTTDGRLVGEKQTVRFGPFRRGTVLYVFGSGADDVWYSFDLIGSAGGVP